MKFELISLHWVVKRIRVSLKHFKGFLQYATTAFHISQQDSMRKKYVYYTSEAENCCITKSEAETWSHITYSMFLCKEFLQYAITVLQGLTQTSFFRFCAVLSLILGQVFLRFFNLACAFPSTCSDTGSSHISRFDSGFVRWIIWCYWQHWRRSCRVCLSFDTFLRLKWKAKTKMFYWTPKPSMYLTIFYRKMSWRIFYYKMNWIQ